MKTEYILWIPAYYTWWIVFVEIYRINLYLEKLSAIPHTDFCIDALIGHAG